MYSHTGRHVLPPHHRISGLLNKAGSCASCAILLFLHKDDIKWCQKFYTCRMEPAASSGLPVEGWIWNCVCHVVYLLLNLKIEPKQSTI